MKLVIVLSTTEGFHSENVYDVVSAAEAGTRVTKELEGTVGAVSSISCPEWSIASITITNNKKERDHLRSSLRINNT